MVLTQQLLVLSDPLSHTSEFTRRRTTESKLTAE